VTGFASHNKICPPFILTDNKSTCVKHCKKVLTHIVQQCTICWWRPFCVVHPSPPVAKSFRKYTESRVVHKTSITRGVLALLSVVPSRSNLVFAIQIEGGKFF